MKKTTWVLAVLAVIFLPATAFAGLDFANSFQTGPGSSAGASITINASGGTWRPTGTVDFSGSSAFNTAVIDALWSNAQDATPQTPGTPDLILWFGSINVGYLELTSVGVSENGSSFVTENFGSPIDGSYSNGRLPISFNDSIVSESNRDAIVAARFTFTYTSATTFTLDGVSTPEPTTFALFGLGLLGLGGAVVRRRRKAKVG